MSPYQINIVEFQDKIAAFYDIVRVRGASALQYPRGIELVITFIEKRKLFAASY